MVLIIIWILDRVSGHSVPQWDIFLITFCSGTDCHNFAKGPLCYSELGISSKRNVFALICLWVWIIAFVKELYAQWVPETSLSPRRRNHRLLYVLCTVKARAFPECYQIRDIVFPFYEGVERLRSKVHRTRLWNLFQGPRSRCMLQQCLSSVTMLRNQKWNHEVKRRKRAPLGWLRCRPGREIGPPI